MISDPETRLPISPEEIWARIQSLLVGFDPQASIAGSDVPAIAALFDTLKVTERDLIATKMLACLKDGFTHGVSFEPIHFAVLALVQPYIGFSNYQVEGRALIAAEFGAFRTKKRSFNEYFSLGLALANLRHVQPEGSNDWWDFFRQYAEDERHRFDAFDVALAGTADTDIDVFGRLITSFPPEPWVVKRLFSFFPMLVKQHSPRGVEELLRGFLARVTDKELRDDLATLASHHGLAVWDKRPPFSVVGGAPPREGDEIPAALVFAHKAISNEKIFGLGREGVNTALSRKKITVITSGYSDNPTLKTFQFEVLELIEDLVGRENVITSDTSTFLQLSPETSARQKFIFAFPMFLTMTKQDMGYSVCQFGTQRTLGVLYPDDSRFARQYKRPTTLKGVLTEVKRNSGQIWVLQNYAIAEIVRQEAERDEQLLTYFTSDHLIQKAPIIEDGNKRILPLFRMPKNHEENIAFVYDLAGDPFIQDRIKAQRRGRTSRDAWMANAVTDVISHDMPIPVGVGFTKYLVPWLLENGHWDRFTELVVKWTERTEFQKALEAVGVESAAAPSDPLPKKRMDDQHRLRSV